MRFNAWFGLWIHSLFGLLTVNAGRSRKHRTMAQRKKEFERGLARRLTAQRYRVTKTRRHKRPRHSAQNARFAGALLRFLVVTLGILLLPVGLIDWGRKSQAERAQERHREGTPLPSQKSSKATAPKSPVQPPVKEAENISLDLPRFEPTYAKAPAAKEKPAPADRNEDVPKSTPKDPKDMYVRKRITLALALPAESTPSPLTLGTYLDLVHASAAPEGKDAVKLMSEGVCVGHIPEKDAPPYLACLRLGKGAYAVITEISDTATPTYEIETWLVGE